MISQTFGRIVPSGRRAVATPLRFLLDCLGAIQARLAWSTGFSLLLAKGGSLKPYSKLGVKAES
jgi:hypothetical protein